MLQGSLDDFALPEVLSLLAGTRKTGELQVTGERGAEGRVWMDGGRVVCSEAGASTDLVDTLFELLRLPSGNFLFSADVAPLINEAQNRLEEWRVIEAVVPSLATRAALAGDLPGEDVIVNAAQWKVLVAVANGGTVDAVATSLGLGEFSACKAVKGLVDAGLVSVDPDEQPVRTGDVDVDSLVQFTRRGRRASHSTSHASGEEATEEPAPAGPSADETADDTESADRPLAAHALARQLAQSQLADDGVDAVLGDDEELLDENGEPINRSLLLKFLSSVRS